MARRSAGEDGEGRREDQEIQRLGISKHIAFLLLLWFGIFVIATWFLEKREAKENQVYVWLSSCLSVLLRWAFPRANSTGVETRETTIRQRQWRRDNRTDAGVLVCLDCAFAFGVDADFSLSLSVTRGAPIFFRVSIIFSYLLALLPRTRGWICLFHFPREFFRRKCRGIFNKRKSVLMSPPPPHDHWEIWTRSSPDLIYGCVVEMRLRISSFSRDDVHNDRFTRDANQDSGWMKWYAKRDHIKLSTLCYLVSSRWVSPVRFVYERCLQQFGLHFPKIGYVKKKRTLWWAWSKSKEFFFCSPLHTRPSNTRKNWARFQASELRWLLDHLHENFVSLKDGLEDCITLLLPQEPGSTLALSSVRSESIKGYVTRIGAWIVKGVSERLDHPQFWYFCVYGSH